MLSAIPLSTVYRHMLSTPCLRRVSCIVLEYYNVYAASQNVGLYTPEKCDGGNLNCSLQFNDHFCMEEHQGSLTKHSATTIPLDLISGQVSSRI